MLTPVLHFSEAEAISKSKTENNAMETFLLRVLEDIGCKDLQQEVHQYFRDQKKG